MPWGPSAPLLFLLEGLCLHWHPKEALGSLRKGLKINPPSIHRNPFFQGFTLFSKLVRRICISTVQPGKWGGANIYASQFPSVLPIVWGFEGKRQEVEKEGSEDWSLLSPLKFPHLHDILVTSWALTIGSRRERTRAWGLRIVGPGQLLCSEAVMSLWWRRANERAPAMKKPALIPREIIIDQHLHVGNEIFQSYNLSWSRPTPANMPLF